MTNAFHGALRPANVARSTLPAGRWRDPAVGFAVAVIALVAGTTTLYAIDVFAVSGGLVWVPFHAALVGFLAAAAVGYRGRSIVGGLVVAYAPFIGFHLEWALLGISSRPLSARLAYFLRPDGLAALGLEAVVVGTVGFVVGRIVRRAAREVTRSMGAG